RHPGASAQSGLALSGSLGPLCNKRSSPRAAWIIEARRVGDAGTTTFANGADGISGAVRATAGEGQRLLEAKHVEGIAAGKRFACDLVKAPVEIEQRDRRAAAVGPCDAELAAVDLVYAVGDIDFHLAAFG